MNYSKIYKDFIKDRLNKEQTSYSERHHIIPRCLKGSDKRENIIRLTPREHYFAHLLLYKIYGGKLAVALMFMSNKNSKSAKGIIGNSKIYDSARKAFSKERKEWFKNNKPINFGKKMSDETKKKISTARMGKYLGKDNPNYGKKWSREKRQSVSISRKGKYCGPDNGMFGKHHSKEAKKKIGENFSKVNKGRKFTEKHKQALSESLKGKMAGSSHPLFGKKHSKNTKILMSEKRKDQTVYQFTHKKYGTYSGIRSDFIKSYNLNDTNVSLLINSKQKTHKGLKIL